ncbi:hypothetical protein VTI28DRAFT_3072 [Corynascus sepedonium]
MHICTGPSPAHEHFESRGIIWPSVPALLFVSFCPSCPPVSVRRFRQFGARPVPEGGSQTCRMLRTTAINTHRRVSSMPSCSDSKGLGACERGRKPGSLASEAAGQASDVDLNALERCRIPSSSSENLHFGQAILTSLETLPPLTPACGTVNDVHAHFCTSQEVTRTE